MTLLSISKTFKHTSYYVAVLEKLYDMRHTYERPWYFQQFFSPNIFVFLEVISQSYFFEFFEHIISNVDLVYSHALKFL